MTGRQPQRRRRERGWVLVSTAALLVVLCGFAALAVDVGLLLSARTAAQRAADAGALAGAFTFVSNSLAPQPDTAVAQAQATATRNWVLDRAVDPAVVNVAVDVPGRLVTVDVQPPVNTFFARVLGIVLVRVGGHAVAEASITATATDCAKPWFVANTMLSTLPPCTACAGGQVFIQGGNVTAWAQGLLGRQFRIKPGNPQNALDPGQFYAIAMGDSRGGSDYRTNIATCSPQNLICQQTYQSEPGNMIGPTKQGVLDLLGPTPDTWVSIGHYARADGTISDTSRQLVSMPVWDTCTLAGFCPSGKPPDNGRNFAVSVVGFAMVFVDGVQGNDVLGHLVGLSACGGGAGGGGGGGGISPGEVGPYALPVRLVRTQ